MNNEKYTKQQIQRFLDHIGLSFRAFWIRRKKSKMIYDRCLRHATHNREWDLIYSFPCYSKYKKIERASLPIVILLTVLSLINFSLNWSENMPIDQSR